HVEAPRGGDRVGDWRAPPALSATCLCIRCTYVTSHAIPIEHATVGAFKVRPGACRCAGATPAQCRDAPGPAMRGRIPTTHRLPAKTPAAPALFQQAPPRRATSTG